MNEDVNCGTNSQSPACELKRQRAIAFYLPQYHPIPENDRWWGPGFTEWTNVARAQPLFRGHQQPRIPADLGFYDLRVPETRRDQSDMATAAGIEAFCYWHYWFAGKRLLQRPFDEVLASGQPQIKFCLGWANHSWTGVWYGAPNRVLIEQTYPGMDDHDRHFEECFVPAFSDRRYFRVDGRPLLLIFKPKEFPESARIMERWRDRSERANLGGLFAVAHLDDEDDEWDPKAHGYDAATVANIKTIFQTRKLSLIALARRRLSRYRVLRPLIESSRRPINVVPFDAISNELIVKRELPYEYYPCVIPNWDNTPRSGSQGSVITGTTPSEYKAHLTEAVSRVACLPSERRIVFIKSWNEWAEGNYLEPDRLHGRAFLDATRQVLIKSQST